MSADFDPYKVLGVDHAAEPDVVATAYRALARRHHPDVSREPDAEARMAEINAAWAILRDPGPPRRLRSGAWHRRRPGATCGPTTRCARSTGTRRTQPRPRPAPPRRGLMPPDRRWAGLARSRGGAGPAARARPARRRDGRSGSVLPFGRHIGWSLGEVARVDPGYLQWLAARPEGAPYRAEIDALLAPLLRTADGRGPLNPSDGPAAHAGWARRPGR